MKSLDKDKVSEHRRRVKDKFLANGLPKGTPQREILEFLLFFAISRKDTKAIAVDLLDKFGTLSNVFDAPIEELKKVKGMGEHSAILIKSIPDIARAYNDDIVKKDCSLNTTDEIGTYLLSRYAYFGNEEVFSVTSFRNNGKFLSFNIVEKGDIGSVGVSTRKVIETLINTKATSVVIAHNHPSGYAIPSDGDLKVTEALRDALKSINVSLVDHIIIAGGDFVSLRQSAKFRNMFT